MVALAGLVVALPLMMGNRTPETLTATAAVLIIVAGAAFVLLIASARGSLHERLPGVGWCVFLAVMTGLVALQVWPSETLARWFGPWPEGLWNHPEFQPAHWSPHVAASLRGWAVFVGLFLVAWTVSRLNGLQRNWIWLAVVAAGLFQALYGLVSHAAGGETILGIWQRHNPDFVHGSFSNRNLFAGYLALVWPMTVAIWWIREVPLLGRLPSEIKTTGSVLSAAVVGAALFASASRLGAASGFLGMVTALVLWTRYRGHLHGRAVWPAYLAAGATFLFAAWYGLLPLAERVVESGYGGRYEVYALMFERMPARWWLHGVGLGGFEAIFKLVQPGHIGGWWDYAHQDLLQWWLEMGLVGLVLLGWVVVAVFRKASLSTERLPLYAGLVALCLVAMGDFSWHIPATQVVLALYLGTLLRGRRR